MLMLVIFDSFLLYIFFYYFDIIKKNLTFVYIITVLRLDMEIPAGQQGKTNL